MALIPMMGVPIQNSEFGSLLVLVTNGGFLTGLGRRSMRMNRDGSIEGFDGKHRQIPETETQTDKYMYVY